MNPIKIDWHMLEGTPEDGRRFLSESERRRWQEMRFSRRQDDFLRGRLAAKQLLRAQPDFAGKDLKDICIANQVSGEPYVLCNGDSWHGSISISHRENLAACALVQGGSRVGIDLEVVEARLPVFVQDYFTVSEIALIDALPEAERVLWVSCIWSAKEAVLKALGVGLRVDSRSVTIRPAAWACRQTGWFSLEAESEWFGESACRLWWRRMDDYVLTLALLLPLAQQTGKEQLSIRPLTNFMVKREQPQMVFA